MVVIDQHQSSMRAGDERLGVGYVHYLVRAPVDDDDLCRNGARQRCE
jgi:hypothetical protein